MSKSSNDATATMVANMPHKTGKSLEQWLAVAQAARCAKHGELVKHLKTVHGMTHGFANLVAHYHFQNVGAGAPAEDELVAAQYAGAKTALKPIYEALVKGVRAFGDDVEIAPKKTYVSLRRKKQFGLIQPSTASRIDVGINLKGVRPQDRLEASGSFNAMVSHRVRLERIDQVDEQLRAWLRQAYEKS